MPSKPLLHISQLSTEFLQNGKWKKAIENVNLQVASGEIIALVGESGSGKSVTSLSITGLLPKENSKIAKGKICFENIVLNQISEKELRAYRSKKIGMIFQEPMTSLNPVEKCGKQVSEVVRLHLGLNKKEAKEKVLDLFKKVRLPDVELIYNKYPFEISGGQKQRVMIAIAMACEPKLLIADEPTTALDPSVSQSILDLIKDLQKENKMGVIFITHDLEILRGFADRIAVMYKGKIIEQAPTRSILNSPKEKYTQALLACRPPKNGKPHRLPTVKQIMEGTYISKPSKKYIAQDTAIEVKDLRMWYPIKKGFRNKVVDHVKAVNAVSFKLRKGETLGLVGESGCGKTTLGRTIVGLEKETRGDIIFEGKTRSEFSLADWKRYRKKVQIIFQDPYSALNPKMTIGDAISEPLFAHKLVDSRKEARKKVAEMLEKVGLQEDHYERYPHEFSGGQRQRIGIARSLILQPEIIVCDESVSALDVSVQSQVLNLLNDLKDEMGLTYLFISHDMDVVRYFSDRVLKMEKGKVKEIEKGEGILV